VSTEQERMVLMCPARLGSAMLRGCEVIAPEIAHD
jgi:hypothetical protein